MFLLNSGIYTSVWNPWVSSGSPVVTACGIPELTACGVPVATVCHNPGNCLRYCCVVLVWDNDIRYFCCMVHLYGIFCGTCAEIP